MLSAIYTLEEALLFAQKRAWCRYRYVKRKFNGDVEDLQSVGQLAVVELVKQLGVEDKIPEEAMIKAIDKAISKEIRSNKFVSPLPKVTNPETGEQEEVVLSRVKSKFRNEVVKLLDDFYYEIVDCAGRDKSEILWLKHMMHFSDKDIIEHFAKKGKTLTSSKIEYAVRDAITRIRAHMKPETVDVIASLKPYLTYSDVD